ncbi:unnamed protein product [Arabidopsis arenosa]|uniref:Uncharacterized protein n=1 Tax=Arabidopsis arenosa TaxID=38785 RepID=A0A8S2AVD9_ARAAE|nr:unnamed protein product [Arabidopsis arenosa]
MRNKNPSKKSPPPSAAARSDPPPAVARSSPPPSLSSSVVVAPATVSSGAPISPALAVVDSSPDPFPSASASGPSEAPPLSDLLPIRPDLSSPCPVSSQSLTETNPAPSAPKSAKAATAADPVPSASSSDAPWLNCPRAKAKAKGPSKPRKKKIKDAPLPPPSQSVPAPSVKGKEKAVEAASPPLPVWQLKQVQAPPNSSSEWIQVKPMSAKKPLVVPSPLCASSSSSQGLLSIDIGLEKVQAEKAISAGSSIASDSSDVHSSEDDVDPEVDESQFLKMFSQRQQRKVRGKGPKPN